MRMRVVGLSYNIFVHLYTSSSSCLGLAFAFGLRRWNSFCSSSGRSGTFLPLRPLLRERCIIILSTSPSTVIIISPSGLEEQTRRETHLAISSVMNNNSSTRASFFGSFRSANLKSSTLILPRFVEMR